MREGVGAPVSLCAAGAGGAEERRGAAVRAQCRGRNCGRRVSGAQATVPGNSGSDRAGARTDAEDAFCKDGRCAYGGCRSTSNGERRSKPAGGEGSGGFRRSEEGEKKAKGFFIPGPPVVGVKHLGPAVGHFISAPGLWRSLDL